jgi:hypothetical protein
MGPDAMNHADIHFYFDPATPLGPRLLRVAARTRAEQGRPGGTGIQEDWHGGSRRLKK